MDFFSIVLFVLGILVLFGIGGFVVLFLVGRRLLLSWKTPYKRAIDSLQRLSHPQLPFLQEFLHHPLFYQWFRTEARDDKGVLATLLCMGDEHTRGYAFSLLSKNEKRKLHMEMKQKRSFTNEDMNRAVSNIRGYLEDEYRHPTKRLDLSFYTLYFYEEYFQELTYIQRYKKTVRPELQEMLGKVIVLVLHSIPYYRERRLYEQQHKLEVFLTKDIPDMLALISQLPPSGRVEKEEELILFLQEFQQEVEEAETSMFSSVERELNVKMRAAKRKFHTP